MMVSVRFQLILFLLCAAYEKCTEPTNRNIQSSFQQHRTMSKSTSFSKGYWNPDRKLGVHVATHFCRGNEGSVLY